MKFYVFKWLLLPFKTLDDWSFDVFSLNEAALGTPVKYLGYDLLNRYGMIHKFKVPPAVLECFLGRVEEGYCRHRNPYHNNLHAADVAQTMHYILCQTGLMVSALSLPPSLSKREKRGRQQKRKKKKYGRCIFIIILIIFIIVLY